MGKTLFEDYAGFVEKFKPKKTTDDCYTPEAVYDVVVRYVGRHIDLSGLNIVRPFYPGGDYEAVEYTAKDIVIDNPPFSILSKIVRFFNANGVRYFLFAPHLTLFSGGKQCTMIVAGANITYNNGAVVSTSFITNTFGDGAIMTAPELCREIKEACKQSDKRLPKYVYPKTVLKVSDLDILNRNGVEIAIPRKSLYYTSKLNSQSKTNIYGGGYLLSRSEAARLEAARLEAARLEAATVWALSPEEEAIVDSLESLI